MRGWGIRGSSLLWSYPSPNRWSVFPRRRTRTNTNSPRPLRGFRGLRHVRDGGRGVGRAPEAEMARALGPPAGGAVGEGTIVSLPPDTQPPPLGGHPMLADGGPGRDRRRSDLFS